VRTILRSGLVALLLAAVAAGCSDTPATPTSPTGGSGSLALTAGQLSGTWTLQSMQAAGHAAQPVPAGASYTLAFADGRVSLRADCNSCGGTYTLSGDMVTLGPNLACTRAACPTMEFEATYLGVLSGDATATLSGSRLVLTSPRGTLSFSR
jgi:heat shock protein HslJ